MVAPLLRLFTRLPFLEQSTCQSENKEPYDNNPSVFIILSKNCDSRPFHWEKEQGPCSPVFWTRWFFYGNNLLNIQKKRRKQGNGSDIKKEGNGTSLHSQHPKIFCFFQKEPFLRQYLAMFPENWNHPKIKTRCFLLFVLFRTNGFPRKCIRRGGAFPKTRRGATVLPLHTARGFSPYNPRPSATPFFCFPVFDLSPL